MRYLSVCSGIESAGHAWAKLGWVPVAFSEIEKFPAAVLAERYPNIPNLGDMTRFEEWPEMAFDVLVGGTPCQAFSVAGKRESLADERGNLTLVFCRLADRYDPELIVWENVPGVLNTRDNAFGCFLAGIVGESAALVPVGGRWTDCGVVAGPRRTAAWRVIDAQGFVPQRRERVFVVCTRVGSRHHPADVLFETEAEAIRSLGNRLYTGPLFPVSEGVRGDSEAGGEAGKDVAPSIAARTRGGGGLGTDAELDGALIAHSLRADGFDASEGGTGRGTPLIVGTAEGGTMLNLTRSNIGKQVHNQMPLVAGTFNAVLTPNGGRAGIGVGAVAFDTAQITSQANRTRAEPGLPASSMAKGSSMHVATTMCVRRLTPEECESLMDLPRGYTAITSNGKPAADGPRYKALGNSMVSGNMLWIGERIAALQT